MDVISGMASKGPENIKQPTCYDAFLKIYYLGIFALFRQIRNGGEDRLRGDKVGRRRLNPGLQGCIHVPTVDQQTMGPARNDAF
jgi:hypothetical protein